ncbi:MAG: hypothetical protein GX754_03340, partial [Clostridiaceae bacterium]|nr:hypothetical protein [Clostridiaceae bacterium]
MDKKNLGKTMRIAMLVVMLLVLQAAVTSSCSGNGEGSLKGVGAVIENTRTIAEGFYAFKPPVTYDILDIEVDKSGVLYIAEKDKVLRISSKKQGHEEPVTGLGYCQNILAANERILLVDQSDEKKMLKIYNTKGTLLGNFEIEAFRIIKMQSLDDKGKTIALLIHDEDRNNKIILLDTENGEITSLDYTNVRLFCTFGKDKICVITPGSPYTLEIYDTANDKVINSVNLSTGVFPDIAYNEKSKTLYCLSSSDIGSEIGTIDLETGTVRT